MMDPAVYFPPTLSPVRERPVTERHRRVEFLEGGCVLIRIHEQEHDETEKNCSRDENAPGL